MTAAAGAVVVPSHDGPSDWHARDPDDALARLGTDAGGLAGDEVVRRRESWGPNTVVRERPPGPWSVLLSQLRSPLIYALLASAVVALVLGELADAAVVLAVVVLNAVVGFAQEFRAGRAVEALAGLVPEVVRTRRDDRWSEVPSDDLVPGDLVAVGAGDRVTADLRVLAAHGLRVDESALTGESVPTGKDPDPVPVRTPLAERASVLHAGTLVSSGDGHGVVVETGRRTQIGRVVGLVDAAEVPPTPLTRDVDRLGTVVTRAIGVVSVLLVAVALLRGYPVGDALLAAITLAVAAVPEGLPAIVTIALAVGVRRMVAAGVVVRQLPAVETLGSTSVICTDKTGTLTRNEMAVRRAWTPDGEVRLDGTGYERAGTVRGPDGDEAGAADGDRLHDLLVAGVLANEARLAGEGRTRTVVGDPTDGALLVAAERGGVDLDDLAALTRRGLLPFDSTRRSMAAAHEETAEETAGGTSGGAGAAVRVKGSPEAVLAHVDVHAADAAREVVHRWTDSGLRVLALASRPGSDVEGPLGAAPLRLLGLVGMVDPPRDGVVEAVAGCLAAGVEVTMITGDHPRTATAIARELGITTDVPAVTGAEVAALDDAALVRTARTAHVFARVEPVDKLRLVRALQADGRVTAMTGDGVNDAPALRQADIGVAMGRGGTAAARDAADVVLVDDDFGAIRAAVEEGRRVYDNLVKALVFALPTNVGEALVVLVAVLAFPVVDGQPVLPVEPVQILWVNLVATVTLALPLAFERGEPGSMARPPRDPREPLLSRFVGVRTAWVGVLVGLVAVGLYWTSLAVDGVSLLDGVLPGTEVTARAQTLAVTGLVTVQVFYLLVCRNLRGTARALGWWSNRWVWVGVGSLLVLQACLVHVPLLQDVFGTTDLTPAEWAVAVAAGAVVVPLVALERRLLRRGQPPAVPVA